MLKDIRKYWFIRLLLYPLSVLYGIITDLRNFLYTQRIFKVQDFDVPVISIGNIIAGGTGKTPFTMLCIDILWEQYQKMVIVSRGYGRKSKGLQVVSDGQGKIVTAEIGGDEPVMIARKYPRVPVIVAANRSEGIHQAIKTFKANLILLDDAFQHRQVARNCDLVLIHCLRNLSAERMLPLGDLREKLSHLKRADIVMLNNSEGNLSERDLDLLNRIHTGPTFDCYFRPQYLVNSDLEKIAEIKVLRDKAVYIFCALAGPEKFIEMLKKMGVIIQKIRIYPDHYAYTFEDLKQIQHEYMALECDYLVTTEKDMVKLDISVFKVFKPVAVGLKGEVSNTNSFIDKLNQFIDIKI
jgi:tetraacyldisaccharide 4'-kinase